MQRQLARTKRLEHAASSVGAPASLAAYLPQLFRGVREFGSDTRLLVGLLRQAGIGPRSWLADLACGKGSLAIEAARALGCRAIGVDLCEPFIDEARRTAERRGLSRRVRFECERIPSWRPGRQFNAVAKIGLGPMTVSALTLKKLVLPGGVLLLDDVVCERAGRPLTGRRSPVESETRRVERYGYRVEHVELPEPDAVRSSMKRLHVRLTANAERLRTRKPHLSPSIDEFLAYLQNAAQWIPVPDRPVIWLLRRIR